MSLLSRSMRIAVVLVVCAPLLLAKSKESGKVVDAGKFGIFVNGNRVGTETFSIEQTATGSLTHCDLAVEQSGSKIEQKSDMQLAANGDLLRYEWKEVSPGKSSTVVMPDDKFLIEHMYTGDKKPFDRPFMLPGSTVILDDFFFTHRELLAWRYVGASCKPGDKECKMQPTKFGGLVPRSGTSVLINIEFKGIESISIKGSPMELRRFDLDVEGIKWSMWMDDSYKVQRLTIAENNTEVLRD